MAEDQDQSQKTEEPTAKKLEDALKKGDIAKSQDVPVWFIVMAAAALLAAAGPLTNGLSYPLTAFLDRPHAFTLSDGGAQRLMAAILLEILPVLGTIFAVLLLGALFGHFVQHPPIWTAEKMKPKLDKLSLIKGVQRMFGPQGWMNLFKAVLKLLAVTAAAAYAVWPRRDAVLKAGELDVVALPPLLQEIAGRLFIAALVVIGIVAAIDYVWQKQSFMKRMRMSREDIKQETKQAEGDPHVRARLRAIRQERSRQRMIAAVPDARVVINNPTHYSVALKYDEDTPAPICVAKGVDYMALKIREAAEEADVPMVENVALARALYAGVEIDEVIPREHFEAVAKVIGFVMRTAENRR
ncbi:MAG: flagellar biosynthesis protein FlhB [Pseudomonadota bacterium]